jgi:hypothetical protein
MATGNAPQLKKEAAGRPVPFEPAAFGFLPERQNLS